MGLCMVHSSESKSESSELFARVLAARALSIKGVRAFLDFSTQEVHPEKEGTFAACKYVRRLSLSKHHHHLAVCAAVLLSLQTEQSGRGWEVLWCLLRDTSLLLELPRGGGREQGWPCMSYLVCQRHCHHCCHAPGLWSTVLAKRAIPVLDYGVVG